MYWPSKKNRSKAAIATKAIATLRNIAERIAANRLTKPKQRSHSTGEQWQSRCCSAVMIVRRFRCTANERSPDLATGASLLAGGSDNFPSVRMLASISYQMKKPRREGRGFLR